MLKEQETACTKNASEVRADFLDQRWTPSLSARMAPRWRLRRKMSSRTWEMYCHLAAIRKPSRTRDPPLAKTHRTSK
eukprot:4344038-Pyramimonas_sp.AAC.1